MSPDLLVELRNFRQNLRDCKADNLRQMRKYKRDRFDTSLGSFMHGMALGKTAALEHLDRMINVLERNDDTQNI
jgi:hypothetical protein